MWKLFSNIENLKNVLQVLFTLFETFRCHIVRHNFMQGQNSTSALWMQFHHGQLINYCTVM